MTESAKPGFEVLKGLPPYGPIPLQFSATGHGLHREGFVVMFYPRSAEAWVGNFQPGLSGFYEVFLHPNQEHFIVVSGGEAYVIDPHARSLVCNFGGALELAIEVSSQNSILFSNGLWFELLGPSGLKWKTKRLSWDGMRNVHIIQSSIEGEGWCYDETWHKFSVELADGTATGGGYDRSPP